MFNSMKKEGYIVKELDFYLFGLSDSDGDRAIDVNAPSQIGGCLRSRYYARTKAPRDGGSIDARTRRIFDNGTYVHIRLQDYLTKMGKLKMCEVPVLNPEYNIQGHTDGVYDLTEELAIIEIKSIKHGNYVDLKDAKEEHKRQGLIYVYCLEERRKKLQNKYKNFLAFKLAVKKRTEEYAGYYQHLTDGNKFTREEKIAFQCSLHNKLDTILMRSITPVTKVIFLYESKDTQELKEFCVDSSSSEGQSILSEVLDECALLNDFVLKKELPPRCTSTKSDYACKYCDFKTECWG